MLIKMVPEQVSNLWHELEPCISQALPPGVSTSPELMNNLLAQILVGAMECWISYVRDKKGIPQLDGIVITQIKRDEVGVTNLLIYAVYGVGIAGNNKWKEGYEALRAWAAANGCANITAYTKVKEICDIATRFGGDASWHYIIMPVV